MPDPLLIAKHGDIECPLLPALANRHGLITGATGTGKTVTLQVIAERLSAIGVPVFMADVKGDLAGLSQPGKTSPKFEERLKLVGADAPAFAGCPTVFWDVYGEQGHPVRATVSDMGPLLLGRILNLNDTQEGVLTLVFKIADDNGLLLLDLKDLRALLQHVGDNAPRVPDQLRQRLRGVDRRDPARPAHARAAGRDQLPRRADAERRRPAADRRTAAASSTSSPPTG